MSRSSSVTRRLAALLFGLCLSLTRAASAYGPPVPSGQLAILDKNGKTTGLCPLKHTDVQADISGFVARVNVRQEFHNPSQEPIEAVYTFPLPADAAVDDMTMTIGQRIVKGQIKRREEARQIYEAAKAAGQAAALLDQERPNIFTQAVANIMPGAPVTISISYVHLLKYDAGQYEFVFPMVVGPRYIGSSVPDAAKITPPITLEGTRAGHDIALAVNLDAGLPLREVKSQLHEVDVTRRGPNRATIRLRDTATVPNKDFILRYKVAGEQMQSGVLAYAPSSGDGYFTLILQPPAAPPPADIAPKEMVFVIDQTGSQMGWPIEKAKETMRHCIQHLNPGDTFQLLGFNTQVYPAFPKPVPATPANIDAAIKYLAPLAGAGGTDILKATDYALQIPTDPARPRIICFMTDGYVGNEGQIIDYVQQHRRGARMFPFGVGNSVNRFLIDGMASEGRGAPFYVALNEPGEVAAAKFYERVANPLLLDVAVDWGALPVADVYPKIIPDVFSAGPIILKGRYTKAAEGDITLHGLLRGQPWRQKIHVKLPDVQQDEGAAMPTIWAREKIQDLQSQDWLGTRGGKAGIQDQIVAVALEYRLMSQYTSFVAVEQRVVNVGGQQRTIAVPVEMPEGVAYEGIFGKADSTQKNLYALGMMGRITTTHGIGGQLTGGAPMPRPRGATAPQGPAGPPGLPGIVAANPVPAALSASAGGATTALKPEAVTELGDLDGSIAEGKEAGQKALEAMKPEERRAVLRRAKLAPALRDLAAKVKQDGKDGTLHRAGGPDVDKGRVAVQIWLNALPPDGLEKLNEQLKALGFELDATLLPNKLLLGTLPVERLDDLLELPLVRRVEPPQFGDKATP